jgi:hypothetical protein
VSAGKRGSKEFGDYTEEIFDTHKFSRKLIEEAIECRLERYDIFYYVCRKDERNYLVKSEVLGYLKDVGLV